MMLAGSERAVSGPNEPPRLDRVIADNWRGLYASAPFSSIDRSPQRGLAKALCEALGKTVGMTFVNTPPQA
jgi:hypothetical protein